MKNNPNAYLNKPLQPLKIDFFKRKTEQIYYSRSREVVYLNVYNVLGANCLFEWLGFGLYHTSVGIFDMEFSYGGHNEALSGIVVVNQGNSAGLVLKERLPVGVTYYSPDEIDEIVEYFGEYWQGMDYDPFSKNCNNFTEQLIRHICDYERFYVPSYINRFCKLGSVLRMWFKPLQEIIGDIVDYRG